MGDRGDGGDRGDRGDRGDWGERGGEINQGEVPTIILGMLESSGFRKYSTLLVIQLLSRRLCLCHCLCGATRSEIWTSVTIVGRTNNQPNNQQGKIELLSQWTMEG